MIFTILLIVQVIVAVSLVVLILLQHGKGADAGAAFGSGASGTVFGAKGTANFMSHATAGLATVFMLISLALAYLVSGASLGTSGSVTDQLTHGSGGNPSSVISTETGHKKTPNKSNNTGSSTNSSSTGGGNKAGSSSKSANKPSGKNSNNGKAGSKNDQNKLKIPD
jgi:preprotein translocase subunit SecG